MGLIFRRLIFFLQDHCSWAIGNLAGGSIECRDLLRKQGVIEPLINLLLVTTTIDLQALNSACSQYFVKQFELLFQSCPIKYIFFLIEIMQLLVLLEQLLEMIKTYCNGWCFVYFSYCFSRQFLRLFVVQRLRFQTWQETKRQQGVLFSSLIIRFLQKQNLFIF